MEFYITSITDPNFDPTKLQSVSEVAQLMAQIEVVLFTRKGEVMGTPEIGCNLEDLIFELNYNSSQLQNEINTQLLQFVPLAQKYAVTTSVDFLSGPDRDAIFIDIVIDNQYQMQVVI